jgi:hypothetical protein
LEDDANVSNGAVLYGEAKRSEAWFGRAALVGWTAEGFGFVATTVRSLMRTKEAALAGFIGIGGASFDRKRRSPITVRESQTGCELRRSGSCACLKRPEGNGLSGLAKQADSRLCSRFSADFFQK